MKKPTETPIAGWPLTLLTNPHHWRCRFSGVVAQARLRRNAVRFPVPASSIGTLLFILPDSLRDALYQTDIIAAVSRHYSAAQVSLLCSRAAAPYFAFLPGIERVYTCDRCEHLSNPRALYQLGAQLSDRSFDLCILLDHDPSAPQHYLLARCAAPVRIGPFEAGVAPVLNIRLRGHPEPSRYCGDRFEGLLAVTGACKGKPVRWAASRQAVEETRHLLKESGITPQSVLIAIDGRWFLENGSRDWTASVLAELTRNEKVRILDYQGEVAPPLDCTPLRQAGCLTVPFTSAARQIALLSQCAMLVSGATELIPLGSLIAAPVTGIFAQGEQSRWLQQTAGQQSLTYRTTPDTIPGEQVASTILDGVHNRTQRN